MLQIANLTFRLDDRTIIEDVSATARSGDIIALIGPNGSGKSTIADLISGFAQSSEGSVTLDGVPLCGLAPEVVAKHGVARSFQSPHLPWNLEVRQCFAAGAAIRHKEMPILDLSAQMKRIAALMASVGLHPNSAVPVRDLSFGQQRLLGIAIAELCNPRLLILDEPFASLKTEVVQAVAGFIRDSGGQRMTVVIDHDLPTLQRLCSQFWFMLKGRLSEHGNFAELKLERVFRSAYLGVDAQSTQTKRPRKAAPRNTAVPLLGVRGLTAGYGKKVVLKEVDFHAHPGEIVGIVGLNGCGKSTLLRAIMGIAHRHSGEIFLRGQRVTDCPPDEMVRRGVRLLVQDCRLFGSLSLRANMELAVSFGDSPRVNPLFQGLKPTRLPDDRPAHTYSGGEQACAALSQMDLTAPQLVMLDEPTAGIDALAKRQLYSALDHWRARSMCTVIVEHSLGFLTEVADRILVVHDKKLHEINNFANADELAGIMINEYKFTS